MTDSPADISFSISSYGGSSDLSIQTNHLESSLDSYSVIFDRGQHNYTASSEISPSRDPADEPDAPVFIPVDANRTFTKEITTTVINAFTGKPISPNPWRKLCTKQISSATVCEEFDDLSISSVCSLIFREKQLQCPSRFLNHPIWR